MSVSTLVLGMWWALASTSPEASSTQPPHEAPVTAEALARCERDLHRALSEAGRFSSARRYSQALLAGLSTSCEGVLSVRLRRGAGEAASARRAERSLRLLDAARGFVPEDCLSAEALRALEGAARCPPPKDMFSDPTLLRAIDPGSYAFALAVRTQLRSLDAYSARAQIWVAEFLLRNSLEGEEAERR